MTSTFEDRVAILQNPRARISGCGLAREFPFGRNPKVIYGETKASASDTSIAFVRMGRTGSVVRPETVVVKIGVVPGDDNSLIVEREIYDRVTNPLLFRRNTPYLIGLVGTIDCPLADFEAGLPSRRRTLNRSLNDLSYVSTYVTGTPKAGQRVVGEILECGGAGLDRYVRYRDGRSPCADEDTFASLPDPRNASMAVILSLVVPVVYTLACFVEVGLRHNDLHVGNVMLSDTGAYQDVALFVTDADFWFVHARVMPRVYDFDNATVLPGRAAGVPKNERLDAFCPQIGACATENKFFDLFTFLCTMAMSAGDPFRAFAESLVGADTDRYPFNFECRLCDTKHELKKKSRAGPARPCDGRWTRDDFIKRGLPAMKPPKKMLQTTLAKVAKRNVPSDPADRPDLDGEPYAYFYRLGDDGARAALRRAGRANIFSLPNLNRGTCVGTLKKRKRSLSLCDLQ